MPPSGMSGSVSVRRIGSGDRSYSLAWRVWSKLTSQVWPITGDTTPDETHLGFAMVKQLMVYGGAFVARCVQWRVPLVCRGAHFCGLVASSMAINLLSAGTSSAFMTTLTLTKPGSNATSFGTPALTGTTSEKDRDAVFLLSVICFVGTVIELLSWVIFWFSTVPSKREWFYSNQTRREYIAKAWEGKSVPKGEKLPVISGVVVS